MKMIRFSVKHIEELNSPAAGLDEEVKKTEHDQTEIQLIDGIPGIGTRSANVSSRKSV